MTTLLLLASILCGLMWMFGSTRLALFVALAAIAGCFGYRVWGNGEDWQSVCASVIFCLLLIPLGWYGATQLIKSENSITENNSRK